MISPHTPPGTEVVAIVEYEANAGFPAVYFGQIYTVAKIVEMTAGQPEAFGCVKQEHGEVEYPNKPGFFFACRLSWFRPLDLGGLDALLDVSEKEPTVAPA
jgi:hypothetical protein